MSVTLLLLLKIITLNLLKQSIPRTYTSFIRNTYVQQFL